MKPTVYSVPVVPEDRATRGQLLVLSVLVVTVVTLLVLVLVAELVLQVTWKEPHMWDRRLMFFSEGQNFENEAWGGFAYAPNARVHAETYYITSLDPAKVEREYGYEYTSNARGRIQHADPDSTAPSMLFLGDSFTEGQGAVPWFYTLEARWPQEVPYKPVNAAVLGVGVEHWSRLFKELSGTLNIRKAVVIYIGDDWTRPVWQFPKQTLACLQSSAQCIGDENFYGLPADSAAAAAQINRVAAYRLRQLKAVRDSTSFLRRTQVYRHLWIPFKGTLRRVIKRTPAPPSPELAEFAVSKPLITELVNALGRENVLFIYLPQRHELDPGPNLYGKLANAFVTSSGYAFFDGRKECGLAVGDYHPHDGHPNPAGYAKIEACVERAITRTFGAGSRGAVTTR